MVSPGEADAYGTAGCSFLSWVGSLLVLFSYLVARTQTNPRASQLIRNLALSDFVWFSVTLLQAGFWVVGDGHPGKVPDIMCYICAPLVLYLRMVSLLWTCAISFDVYMSVSKRKWHWAEEKNWFTYNRFYNMLVYMIPLPGAIYVITIMIIDEEAAGCEAGYERLNFWYLTLITELLPIVCGFMLNVWVYLKVRGAMALKAYPQSVRKKRRRIMYHYIVVCIICWSPTMVFYATELFNYHCEYLELTARICLYLTGFLNFLVFGMQDPHIKRSFQNMLFRFGCACLLAVNGPTALKTAEVDKSVCFEEATISGNADISKDKKNIYRHHKLSKADKLSLYEERPDLDPSKKKKKRRNKVSSLHTPLLSGSVENGESYHRSSRSANSGEEALLLGESRSSAEYGDAEDNGMSYSESESSGGEMADTEEGNNTEEDDHPCSLQVLQPSSAHRHPQNIVHSPLGTSPPQAQGRVFSEDEQGRQFIDHKTANRWNSRYSPVSTGSASSFPSQDQQPFAGRTPARNPNQDDSSPDEADEEDVEYYRRSYSSDKRTLSVGSLLSSPFGPNTPLPSMASSPIHSPPHSTGTGWGNR